MRSGPPGRGAAGGRRASPRASRLQRLRLVHEHDGDVVLAAVHQLARLADDLLPLLAELQLALALGAGEDLLELRRHWHGREISRKTRQLPEQSVTAERLVRPRPRHRRAGSTVEEAEPQQISAHEPPEGAEGDVPRTRPAPLRVEHPRRLLAVALHLGEAVGERIVSVVEDRGVESSDGPGDDQLLMHRAAGIVPASVAAEEADVP